MYSLIQEFQESPTKRDTDFCIKRFERPQKGAISSRRINKRISLIFRSILEP